jgi:arylsulfatase A-like enzyme
MRRLVCALGLALLLSGSAAGEGVRPNILLLILDDVGTELVGAYEEGDDPASTPNIDSLAEDGVLFRNVYSSPVCSPTRATILTGRYGFANGIGEVANGLIREDIPNLPAFLPAEYRKGVVGKWHLARRNDEGYVRHPVDFAGFESYAGKPGNFAVPHTSNHYYHWEKFTAVAGQEGYETEVFWCMPFSHGHCYITSVMIDDVIDRVRAYDGEPWFLWVGFQAIHLPLDHPRAAAQTAQAPLRLRTGQREAQGASRGRRQGDRPTPEGDTPYGYHCHRRRRQRHGQRVQEVGERVRRARPPDHQAAGCAAGAPRERRPGQHHGPVRDDHRARDR